jgi:hypothetical protein
MQCCPFLLRVEETVLISLLNIVSLACVSDSFVIHNSRTESAEFG